jgi:hypothetical protein
MKNIMKTFIITACLFALASSPALPQLKKRLGLMGIDSYNNEINYARSARVELEKLGLYEIIDRYDMEYLLQQQNIETKDCFGKLCLVEAGKAIEADKMFTGSIESFSDRIVVSVRLINVAEAKIEKSETMEFYHYPQEVDRMLEVTIKQMHGVTVDSTLAKQIIRPDKYESILNPPIVERLKLSGPRMGFTYFGGATGERLIEEKTKGGYDAYPFMFQFGYQFETQYLNEGNLQALFEFIPMISGVDQGYFIPSLTVLHGLRNNRSGWEFALGPSINMVREAEGYFDSDGNWQINLDNAPSQEVITRLDSRGIPTVRTGFVVAFGKTLRSGRLNVPVNIYFMPNRDGFRCGLSFGFNAKKQGI